MGSFELGQEVGERGREERIQGKKYRKMKLS